MKEARIIVIISSYVDLKMEGTQNIRPVTLVL